MTLHDEVEQYQSVLAQLNMMHVRYFKDMQAFGDEVDSYENDFMALHFIRDRGYDTAQVAPIDRDDPFDVTYMVAILKPELVTLDDLSICVRELPSMQRQLRAIFSSQYYACYRRMYISFENCRGLWSVEQAVRKVP